MVCLKCWRQELEAVFRGVYFQVNGWKTECNTKMAAVGYSVIFDHFSEMACNVRILFCFRPNTTMPFDFLWKDQIHDQIIVKVSLYMCVCIYMAVVIT